MNVSRNHALSRVQAAHLHSSASRLPLALRSSLIRPRDNAITRSRHFWWWSRRNEWSVDEDMEQRFLRHQRQMRNKYSKLLRRRSIWEDDEHALIPIWARSRRWLVTRWADKKALSYRRALQAQMEEPNKRSEHDRPWKEWDKDFDKLKTRIDEAIERDPYGTLFGRHLRGPPSPNNSSWTSFSWVYGSLRPTPGNTPDEAGRSSSQPVQANANTACRPSQRTVFSVPLRPPSAVEAQRTSQAEQEYEFDPISMRKVLKQKHSVSDTVSTNSFSPKAETPKAPFLKRLFSEHGVDIPVKTCKPHKVYGYGGSDAKAPAATQENAAAKPTVSGIGLESSRLRDLQALKFRTLGTSLDTTAEFGGKYKVASDPEPILLKSAKTELNTAPSPNEKPKSHDVNDVSGEDTAIPFAGTTYESKSQAINSATKPNSSFKTSWLMKEGFQTPPQALSNEKSRIQEPTAQVKADVNTKSSRIEPALDRVKASDNKTCSRREASIYEDTSISKNTAEDLDLLRASDVRAATRSVRTTRQEIAESKDQARKQLETDYSMRQIDGTATMLSSAPPATKKASRSLSNVWEHVKLYPQGIVAKTIKHMGIFNENFKTYVRLDKPAQDSTEKLVFKDETLSKIPSIYKKIGKKSAKPLQTFTPSQEVVDVEKAEKARLAFVRRVNEESKRKALEENKRAEELAVDIRNVYEEEYGKIDLNHRQPLHASVTQAEVADMLPSKNVALRELKKPEAALQPMGPATVKPGIEEDPVIKDHITTFEPKLANIIDEAKLSRKAIHEAKLEVVALRARRPKTIGRFQLHDDLNSCRPKSDSIRIEPALDRSTEKYNPVDSLMKSTERQISPEYNSEYVILAYDPSSKTVTTSSLDSSMSSIQDSAPKTGVPQTLASLNHTAKFLSHFATLSNQGYEVASGGGDVLVFKKRAVKAAQPAKSPLLSHVKAIIAKNKLVAQEVVAEPTAKTVPASKAATVLDEIPASEPTPGPAGPTAPPLGPPSFMRPKVRRQETVFSASKASRVSPPPGASTEKKVEQEAAKELPKNKDGMWKRFKRSVKRVVLTAAAMGVGAYTIGAIAESLGAQEQPVRAVRSGRPGIYSTEDSR